MNTAVVEFRTDFENSYVWMLRHKRAIMHPVKDHRTLRQCVNDFKAACDVLDLRAPIEVVDGPGVHGSHALLIGK